MPWTTRVTESDAFPHWCTRYGGVLALPVVGLIVLAASGLCMLAIDLLDDIHTRGLAPGWFTPRREIYGFSLLAVSLSIWLVLGQAFAYVTKGQARKIEFIKGFFPPTIIAAYFREFSSGKADALAAADVWFNFSPNASGREAAAAALAKEFDTFLKESFGLSVYALPSILFAIVAFIVLFLGYAGGLGYAESLTIGSWSVRPLGLSLDLVSIAAIFGAFTWIASDAIVRNHQWTFHPSDLSWYTLRLIIAVPLGQTIAVLNPSSGPFLAFVISMFSFERISAILGSLAAKTGAVPSISPAERDDIILVLPGVDEDKARTLALEGVSTILQLIAIDPIRTSIRTGLPFEFVVSLIDAAILWNAFGTDLPTLRPFGFPGASYVLNYLDQERAAQRNQITAAITAGTVAGADAYTLAKAAKAAGEVQGSSSDSYLLSHPTDAMSALLTAIETMAQKSSGSRIDKLGLQNVFAEIACNDYADFIRNMYNTRAQTTSCRALEPTSASSRGSRVAPACLEIRA